MKKLTSLLLVLVLLFTMAAFTGHYAYAEDMNSEENAEASTTVPDLPPVDPQPVETTPEEPQPSQPDETTPEETQPSQPDETAPEETQPSQPDETTPEEPQPSQPPVIQPTDPIIIPPATEAPTVPAANGIPVVTKHPTSESVKVGGYAEFVARADYCDTIIWHFLSPSGGWDIMGKDAPNHFPGLNVTGLETERLALNFIPKEMDEWRVRAEFVGRDGNAWSDSAIINVMNQELAAPTITEQPKSVSLKATEATLLRVGALTSENNTTLTYQWYRNTSNTNMGGKAILGATTPTFTPDFVAGTTYYYCAIRCTTGSEISVATKTQCAAVTYPESAVETTAPTIVAADIPAPTETTAFVPEQQPTQAETLPQITVQPQKSNTLLVIVVVVIIIIALLGIVATVLILKFYPGRDEDDEEEEYEEEDPDREVDDLNPPFIPQPQKAKPTPAKKPAAPSPFLKNEDDDTWDDLSDLGDLSFYLGDEDK